MQKQQTVFRQITQVDWSLPKPFSLRDVVGSLILLSMAISIWFIGDFHTFHYSDDLIHSLSSLYRWTPLSWESDHIGSLLSLLASFIQRPYWNVLAVSTASSFLFLGGLTLWASLLATQDRSLFESAIWVLLLLPLVLSKHRIFDNASHGSTFGAAFFFAGAYVHCLSTYPQSERPTQNLFGQFFFGFLTTYLSKTVLIPVGVVMLCMIAEQAWLKPKRGTPHSPLAQFGPAVCLGLALLAYHSIELAAPVANDFELRLNNIPISLPVLLENWGTQELTTPVLVAIPLVLFLFKPPKKLLVYLAAGALVEMLIVSSSRWVIIYNQSGYYLTDLTFLILLIAVLVASQFIRFATPNRFHRFILPILTGAALLVNAREWDSFSPTLPFTAMDRSIGANTSSIVEAGCDILIGDNWKVWPATLAANDYYYRNHISDPRTDKTRMVATISLRSSPTEHLWRPRLDWPDVKLCRLTGDEWGMQSALQHYAPDTTLFLVQPQQFNNVIAYHKENRRLANLDLAFDSPAPGEGWSYPETTPSGETFAWMTATTANLYLPLATSNDVNLEFRVIMTLAPDVLNSLTLQINGQAVPLTSTDDGEGPTIFHATLRQSVLSINPYTTILTFHINHTVVPEQVIPGSDDRRALGLAFDWLQIK